MGKKDRETATLQQVAPKAAADADADGDGIRAAPIFGDAKERQAAQLILSAVFGAAILAGGYDGASEELVERASAIADAFMAKVP